MDEKHYTPNATCIHCGYAIDLLGEHRCAECGQPFDPYDWDTYRSPNRNTYEPFTFPPLARLVCAVLLLLWVFYQLIAGMPIRFRQLNEGAFIISVIVPLAVGFGFAMDVLIRGRGLVRFGALLVLATQIFFIVTLAMGFLLEILNAP